MATLTMTVPVNGYAGNTIRALAKALEDIAGSVPDQNATGASVVLTFDNAPSTGLLSVALTAGPYTSATYKVG